MLEMPSLWKPSTQTATVSWMGVGVGYLCVTCLGRGSKHKAEDRRLAPSGVALSLSGLLLYSQEFTRMIFKVSSRSHSVTTETNGFSFYLPIHSRIFIHGQKSLVWESHSLIQN